ncbi:MAG: alpha/beta hydrolase [Pseudomonadales bacterium]
MIYRDYVDTSAGQVHYRYAGDKTSPVVVLLHQAPSNSAMFELLMAALQDEYFLIAPDFPGFGLSDPLVGALSIEALTDVILLALDALNIQSITVFGHHTGTCLAVQVAARRPQQVAKVVLSGPALLTDEIREILPSLAAPIPPTDDGSYLHAMWDRISAKDPDADASLIQREVLQALELGPVYQQTYQAVCDYDFSSALSRLVCPVLVFAGTEDLLHSRLDDTLAILADGHKAEIVGARTYVCERNADQVGALIRDFIVKD